MLVHEQAQLGMHQVRESLTFPQHCQPSQTVNRNYKETNTQQGKIWDVNSSNRNSNN